MESFTVTAFTLGRSTVVTIPKKLGIKSGTPIKISKNGSKILLEPKRVNFNSKRAAEIEKKLKIVRKLAGGIKGSFPYTPEELNQMYDEETYGNLEKFLK